MKSLYITCCIILGIALLPISGGFYTLVRIIVTVGAVAAITKTLLMGLISGVLSMEAWLYYLIPLIPVYLHDKGAWIMIDILTIALFIYRSKNVKPK